MNNPSDKQAAQACAALKMLALQKRFAQLVEQFVLDGWLLVYHGTFALYLRHPNGNRMTIAADSCQITYVRNGRLVKTEPLPKTGLPPRDAEKPEVTRE